jgi:DNA-binding IclR family transcriptional regulator
MIYNNRFGRKDMVLWVNYCNFKYHIYAIFYIYGSILIKKNQICLLHIDSPPEGGLKEGGLKYELFRNGSLPMVIEKYHRTGHIRTEWENMGMSKAILVKKNHQDEEGLLGYQAPAVQKAFLLLKTVAEAREGMHLTEISHDLGFSKSTTHGLIQALLKVGALDQSPFQKKVFLGASFVDLASKSGHYYGITERIQPVIDTLSAGIGLTVFLGVLNESGGTIIANANATRSLTISSSPGSTVPFMAGALGKAFLASLSKSEALKIIRKKGLRQFTPRSIVDEQAYLKELKWVRRNGYALDNEEYLVGVKAVTVNLGIFRSLPLLMWGVGFAAAMTEKNLPGIIQKTLEAAEKVKSILKEMGSQ